MLGKFFEALYNKVFVNIIVNYTSTDINIQLCSKNGVMQEESKNFQSLDLNDKMLDFINSYTKETPYYYVSILDMSMDQGALPTCSTNRLSFYHDVSSCEYKCSDEKWTYYTEKTDLYGIEKHYSEIGIDFVFSPFTVLTTFFKDKIDTNVAMYILVQHDFISLCMFDNSELLFAKHLALNSNEGEEISSDGIEHGDDIELNDGIDLDDVDVLDDMEELDDFGDIEDLDSIEDIDEFSETQDVEDGFQEGGAESEESDEGSFNEDYERFILIQDSVASFYNDKKYNSAFIESVYVADSVGVSNELKKFLEEEMFLSVYVRRVELGEEISALAKMELNL